MQSLAGTMWKLIEASAFDEAGQVLPSPLGPHPIGFAMCEAERVIVAVSDDRTSLVVTTVDGASSPDLSRQQVRHIHIETPTRMVVTPKNPVLGRTAGLKLVWQRIG
jgi:hypothetical protein